MIFLFFWTVICEIQEPIHKRIVKRGDDGSEFYRIPAIAFAPDNKTLITATDKRWSSIYDLPRKIDVIIKTSEDNGKTWTPALTITGGKEDPIGYGDPVLIVDRQENLVFCLFTGDKGTFDSGRLGQQRDFYCVSKDNGHTWSSPIEITDMLYGINCRDPVRAEYYSCFLTSGSGLQTRSGRLMLVGVVRETKSGPLSTHTVYSDDHGKTWSMSNYHSVLSGDESKVVELNNGSILMDIRTSPKRRFTISNDEGMTWGEVYVRNDMQDPACNGEIIRYTSTLDGYNKDRLIHTNLRNATRRNLVIKISYDEGNTWPVEKVIYPSYAIYSAVTTSPIDGKIYVYWEKSIDHTVEAGCDMVLTTLTLDWVTDGKDTWTPPNKN